MDRFNRLATSEKIISKQRDGPQNTQSIRHRIPVMENTGEKRRSMENK